MGDDVDMDGGSVPERWRAQFEEAAVGLDDSGGARIVREDRGLYRTTVDGVSYAAEVTGAFRHGHVDSEEFPAVGDWVVATRVGDEEKLRIHAVVPRATVFRRTGVDGTSDAQVVAANVDTVFIVVGMDGDFNVRRVERYIALGYESGAQPVVVLSKSDLVDAPEVFVGEIESVAIGVPVHVISSIARDGVEALQEYLGAGKTVACLGSSGAGKSTLINALLGEEVMATGSVREDDSRGRHMTTHRQLIELANGASLIDTPGMRELQLTGDDEGLSAAFEDVEALIGQCRFGDCGHGNEPGCAIRVALESGELDAARFRSYEKLQRELAYVQRRQGESYDYKERQRTKALGKYYKRTQNEKKNRF